MAKAGTSELESGVTIRGAAAEQRLFGRYTLKRVLGRGGMGIVWLAHDDELKRSVAMKFLPDMIVRDREAVEDLKRETRRSLDLTHHHIVRIYDFTQDENSAAIIMEYVDGETLSAMKTQQPGGCFSVSNLAVWAGHFCQALDYAHRQARVVHRDLKPANLMVNSRGDLKITDFGISRSMSDSMTRVSMSNTAGTLAYMSPEQALGAPPAPGDDIYAFGATIYDLLTGRPPFFRGNLQVQLETVIPPPMHARRAELGNSGEAIPALWEEVIAACLAKKPQDRPQSMGEIANLLGIGGPTTGYRPGTSPTFAPLTGVLVPSTTRATQQAQPPTSPTQRTLSPDELMTQAQMGAAARPPTAQNKVHGNQTVKPTSMGDVIPGFDFALRPKTEAEPAAVTPAAPEDEEKSAEIDSTNGSSPAGEAVQFPTMVGKPRVSIPEEISTPVPAPEEIPVVEEAALQPVEASQGIESVESEEAEPVVQVDSSQPSPEVDVFPTLRGEAIAQIAEEPPSEEQLSLQAQPAQEANESYTGGTLADPRIHLPTEPEEVEFPTFAGTPLNEPAAETLTAPPELPPAPLAYGQPKEDTSQYAAEAFSAPPPPVSPRFSSPPRKSRSGLYIVLVLAVAAIGVAVWLGTRPPDDLAKRYVEQGRRYLATDSLEEADSQARLALQKNSGSSDATQLQRDVQARRQVLDAAAAEAAAASKRDSDKRAAEQSVADQQAAAQRLAEQKAAEERLAREREAAQLVTDAERLLPSDLAAARAKTDEALKKVPEFAPATALLARITARQQTESTVAKSIAEARAAVNRRDPDAAESALRNLSPELAEREDVRDLQESISRMRDSLNRPQPTPNRGSKEKPTPKPTPKPKPPVRPKSTVRDTRPEPTVRDTIPKPPVRETSPKPTPGSKRPPPPDPDRDPKPKDPTTFLR